MPDSSATVRLFRECPQELSVHSVGGIGPVQPQVADAVRVEVEQHQSIADQLLANAASLAHGTASAPTWWLPGLVIPDGPVDPHSVWAEGTEAIFTPEQTDYVLRQQPLRRLTTADDIASAVLCISSPLAARQVTGQVVAVGGGSTMP